MGTDKMTTEAKSKKGTPQMSKEKITSKATSTLKPKKPMEKPRMLQNGTVILNRFEVEGLVGAGSFAQVYRAIDKVNGQKIAIKVENEPEKRRMVLEFMLMVLIRGQKHIPEVYGSDVIGEMQILVMQLVGRSLADIRRQMPSRCFSLSTVYRAIKQIATAASVVHSVGFIHRDLKPPNFCIGAIDVGRIYLLDFGLCRKYLNSQGAVRHQRTSTGTRGTFRYMSLLGHARKEVGPGQDLVALIYSAIEMGDGGLPWSNHGREESVLPLKKATSVEKLCEHQPLLLPLAKYVMDLSATDIPQYDFVFAEINKCIGTGVTEADPYDWELNNCELELTVKPEEATVGHAMDNPMSGCYSKTTRTTTAPTVAKPGSSLPHVAVGAGETSASTDQ